MGRFYSLTCMNKDCNYHVDLREGPGMRIFVDVKSMELAIKEGKYEAPEDIKRLIDKGFQFWVVYTFMCPTCKEYQTCKEPFIFEPILVSPYGSVRDYKLHFLEDEPHCDECGSKLIFVPNPRSSKNKCPKCGIGEMEFHGWGYYD